ncbi:hypothetical protein GGQ85_004197 [Nitrobacter vulgaris]|uniref:hypothetical protein n=1 Tax=Nitrobacter vulgaris TaxID=29421 RepID=UPI002858DD25|nr:hypothetical protein [Nitrobacter vulgaris]MDR6306465.1 hypothetical protein [Nitrobacter vulgaris]
MFLKIKSDVEAGRTGILSDQEMQSSDQEVWAEQGLADYFPGNVPLWHLGFKTLLSAGTAASTLTALQLPFGARIERTDDHERNSNS